MELNLTTITFVGGGNMARSLISGLIKQGLPRQNIQVIEPNSERALSLRTDFSIKTVSQASEEIFQVNFIVFAIKPQIFKTVCNELASLLSHSPAIILSIAAGIKTQQIRQWLELSRSASLRIVRSMPNTPALIGLGATGLYSSDDLSVTQKLSIEAIFNAVGISIWVNSEDDLDTVTALSGSGPAYFFRMCELLIDAGTDLGLNSEQAYQLVVQTALGAAQLAKSAPNKDIESLRKNVTSKGGTTEAGLNVLSEENFKQIIVKVIKTAKNRSHELAEDYL